MTQALSGGLPVLLGLPLEEAVSRLAGQGIRPQITITRAPRRPEGVGALRVVRVAEGGRLLIACAFLTGLKEDG